MCSGANESNSKFFPEGYVAKIKHGNESFWCQYPWNFIQYFATFGAKCCLKIMAYEFFNIINISTRLEFFIYNLTVNLTFNS